jgi:hypothetical protein
VLVRGSAREAEARLFRVERFPAQLRHPAVGQPGSPVRKDRRSLKQYPHDDPAPGSWSVAEWITRRFQPAFPGLAPQIAGRDGPAGLGSRLAKIRRVHANEWSRLPSSWAVVGFQKNDHPCDWDPACWTLWSLSKAELLEVAVMEGIGDWLDVADSRQDVLETLLDHRGEVDADTAELRSMTKRELEQFATEGRVAPCSQLLQGRAHRDGERRLLASLGRRNL